MHVTRGSTQHRYTEIPRPPLQPKTKLLDVRARSSRPRAIMQTRRGAQKRGRDSGVQAGPPRAGDPAVGAQVETLAGDEHISDAHAQTAEDESIAPSAGSEGGSASESAQPISGIAPRDTHDDERPNAAPPAQQPSPVGHLIRVFTPYGDLDGTIDPSGAGAWHNIWDDTPQPGQRGYQPGSSSTSSEWPSSALKRSMFCNPSGPPPAATTTPAEPSHGMSGQLVPFGEQQQSRLHPTRSDSSVSMPGSRLQHIMQGLRESNQAEELKARAEQVARAIAGEQEEVRRALLTYPDGHYVWNTISDKRPRKPVQPSRNRLYIAANTARDTIPASATYLLHQQHLAELIAEQPSTHAAQQRALVVPTGQHSGLEQYQPIGVAVPMEAALQGDGRYVAWAKASCAIGEAAQLLMPAQLGRNKKGGPLITGKMRDQANRTRAACQLASALSLQTIAGIWGRDLIKTAMRLHDDEPYSVNCADELVTFLARWGTSTLKGALSTLTRLRAYAEAKGEYDAADNDTYPAQLTNSFLDEVNVKAFDAAKAYREKAEAEGRVLTAQQQRRDGRTAAKTAFRSLRWLLDNVKMATAADDALVCKRKFGTTISIPTPALEPPHYAQLCYLATHHHSRVVRGTAAGFALVASQTSRFKQAQACAILAEKNGVLYTCVQVDKSNEPHKQSPRPAFGPILDAYGSRGVIDAVYDALRDVEEGCFLVRDNDSASGAPVEGCAFTNGPILGGRADAALQFLLSLPPLACKPPSLLEFKVHSLKPMMLKHAARMLLGPIERHGLGRFSGSAAQSATLVPEPAELKKHRLKCAVLPDRYAQSTAFARDARMAIRVSKDIQRLASAHTIEELTAMDWAEGPGTDGDDAPDAEAANDAAPAPAQVCHIEFTRREQLEMTRGLYESGLLDGVDSDYGHSP
jgi:hypothetical protein